MQPGKVIEQKAQFCKLAKLYYTNEMGLQASEAHRKAVSDWMQSPFRAALIGSMSETEQVRRRFRKPRCSS